MTTTLRPLKALKQAHEKLVEDKYNKVYTMITNKVKDALLYGDVSVTVYATTIKDLDRSVVLLELKRQGYNPVLTDGNIRLELR